MRSNRLKVLQNFLTISELKTEGRQVLLAEVIDYVSRLINNECDLYQ